jgi:hypothetical protein
MLLEPQANQGANFQPPKEALRGMFTGAVMVLII